MLLIVGMKGQEADLILIKKEDRNIQIKTMADLNKGRNRGQEINIKRNKDIKEMIEIMIVIEIEIVTETETDMIIEIAKEMGHDKEEEVKVMIAIVKAEETEIENTKSQKKIPIFSKENKSKELDKQTLKKPNSLKSSLIKGLFFKKSSENMSESNKNSKKHVLFY